MKEAAEFCGFAQCPLQSWSAPLYRTHSNLFKLDVWEVKNKIHTEGKSCSGQNPNVFFKTTTCGIFESYFFSVAIYLFMGQCGAGDQVWPFDAGRILFKSLLCQEMFVWPYWSYFSKIPFSHVKIHCRWLFFGVLWGYYEVNCARGSVCCPCNEKHYQTSVSFPFYFGESESQNLEKKPQS